MAPKDRLSAYDERRGTERGGHWLKTKSKRNGGANARKFCADGQHFLLEEFSPQDEVVSRRARGRMSERGRSACSLKPMMREFTLPMLVIRNYVLEPE
jgi:hypothetical protein